MGGVLYSTTKIHFFSDGKIYAIMCILKRKYVFQQVVIVVCSSTLKGWHLCFFGEIPPTFALALEILQWPRPSTKYVYQEPWYQ